eukprot:g6621.t1
MKSSADLRHVTLLSLRELEEKGCSENLLRRLCFLFTDALVAKSAKLAECGAIRRTICASGRTLYEVSGSAKRAYVCLIDEDRYFCNCHDFCRKVSSSCMNDAAEEIGIPMCKHILAVLLALGEEKKQLGELRKKDASDLEMAVLISTRRQ